MSGLEWDPYGLQDKLVFGLVVLVGLSFLLALPFFTLDERLGRWQASAEVVLSKQHEEEPISWTLTTRDSAGAVHSCRTSAWEWAATDSGQLILEGVRVGKWTHHPYRYCR